MTNRDTWSTSSLSHGQVAAALAPFGVTLSEAQLADVTRYVQLLLQWNQTVNLTAVKDPLDIVARHFGESLFPSTFMPMETGRLADVGSGAGFPGMALKIAFPSLQVFLLEPNRKKCAFLAEIKTSLNLTGVEIIRERYEDFGTDAHSFDYICSRALGDYRRLLRWAQAALKTNGQVILWLGAEDSTRLGNTGGWNWSVPRTIPESRRRVILYGGLK